MITVLSSGGNAQRQATAVSLAESMGSSPREIHRIRKVIEAERVRLIRAIDTVCERES
jgi:hypothetical protein